MRGGVETGPLVGRAVLACGLRYSGGEEGEGDGYAMMIMLGWSCQADVVTSLEFSHG